MDCETFYMWVNGIRMNSVYCKDSTNELIYEEAKQALTTNALFCTETENVLCTTETTAFLAALAYIWATHKQMHCGGNHFAQEHLSFRFYELLAEQILTHGCDKYIVLPLIVLRGTKKAMPHDTYMWCYKTHAVKFEPNGQVCYEMQQDNGSWVEIQSWYSPCIIDLLFQ